MGGGPFPVSGRPSMSQPRPPLPPVPRAYTALNTTPVRLIYAKSGFQRRLVSGFFTILSIHPVDLDITIAWIPNDLVSAQDRALLLQLDGFLASERGFPSIQLPLQHPETMTVRLSNVYSIYVRPPQDMIITMRHGDILDPLYWSGGRWPGYDILDVLGAFVPLQRSPDHEWLYKVVRINQDVPDTAIVGNSSRSGGGDPLREALDEARWNILQRFARITQLSRSTAAQILEHPVARAITPLLPPSIQALCRNVTVQRTMDDYDRATIYLARWAAGEDASKGEWWRVEDSEALLNDTPEMKMPPPVHTRRGPVVPEEWVDLFDGEGKLCVSEDFVYSLIFRGGLDPDVRIEAWKFLLGMYSWDSTFDEREAIRRSQIDEYYKIKAIWFNDMDVRNTKAFLDEKHRIDKDVHRTDRTMEAFEAEDMPNPDPDMTVGTNMNLEIMKDILVTYNFYNTELGYVQGMSDLLAPIFVAMGTEEMAFWGFVKFMDRVQSNFFMDQSGMHRQLDTLRALIRFMDPRLYKHFEETETTNLFFCFRWLLVWFKREFEWNDVIRLWEVLWTDYLSTQMLLFVALAVLDQHRQVILEQLSQFDEILKYTNELSGKIGLQETLERAEVLFYQFERRVRAMDRKRAELQQRLQERSIWNNSEERAKIEKHIENLSVDDKLRVLLTSKRRRPAYQNL